MTTHWIAWIGRPNARVMKGKAKFTDESNGTTSVPSAITSTPNPDRDISEEPGRITRSWLRAADVGGSDRLLQCRRGLESDGLAGLHLDRFAGARVEALARLGLANGESAETRK